LERSYSQIGDAHGQRRALKKITGSGERLGLLDREEANDVLRRKAGANRDAETTHVPEQMLGESLDPEENEPFLRGTQRVPLRRRRSRFGSRFGWKNRWIRLLAGAVIVLVFGLLALIAIGSKSLLLHNPRFLLRSGDNVQIDGNRVVTGREVLAVFAPDLGHSVFRVPLAKRQAQLEQIPWVRLATVMRLWPDRLRVRLAERTPVAFVRDGNAVRLVDDQGVLLGLPDAVSQHYSFPVLSGISVSDPLADRATRVKAYLRFSRALDAEGEKISATLSEVDLSDPEDIRAVFIGGAHQPLVHFGNSDFLPRYRAYQAHLAEWLQQYPQLRSVDMRYGKQVVLDTGTTPPANDDSMMPRDTNAIRSNTLDSAAGTAAEAEPTKVTPANAKPKLRNIAAAKPRRAASHPARRAVHRAAVRRHSSKRDAKRGHIVRHPIMHVVKGA
jgi:cell division protein FtsQ